MSAMSESISINVEGVTVEGEVIHRSHRDIALGIVSPYQGLTTGRHIPAFARISQEHDYCGPYGDETAAALLKELYQLGRFVEENKALLRSRVAEMDAAIERLDQERLLPENEFHEVRRDLRTQLCNGSLDSKVYQQCLVQARKKVKARQREIWHLEEDFFKTHFPMIVPVGTRDEVLTILRSPV
jgi:hypothetical protein